LGRRPTPEFRIGHFDTKGTTVGEPLQMGQHRRQGDIPFRRKNPFRIGAEFPGHSRHIANLNMVELFGGEP